MRSAAVATPRQTPSKKDLPAAHPAVGAYPAEQTMVPAEDTIAAPVTPARAMLHVDDSPSTAELDGDHDGLTVASIDLRRLRAERAARGGGSEGAPVADGAVPASAPVLNLRLPDGSVEPLDQAVVLGRSPSVSNVPAGAAPAPGHRHRAATRTSPAPMCASPLEGGTVVVTDLHSRNGTTSCCPAASAEAPRRASPPR